MTPLARLIAARIRDGGPMDLAEYMQTCLLHPQHGYYSTRDPFGQAGDFTTAPEISQMFGELLGLALAQAWIDQGRPDFILAEPGPGRGTLMADMLRAMRAVPGMVQAAQVYLIEASPHLREVQRQKLGQVKWLDEVDDLPQAPLFMVANEFFDALPIRQFHFHEGRWSERVVGLTGDSLTFGLVPADLPHEGQEGDILELCPAAHPITQAIASRIAQHGGAAIFLDYGGWNGRGDTFQALRNHAPDDPLAHPGQADLTAHVDFAPLAAAAMRAAAAVSWPETQGALLTNLGIHARAAKLAEKDPGAAGALHRLTDPAEMGTLFKALALWHPAAPPVPGFKPLRSDANDA